MVNNLILQKKKFEDTKGVIRSQKSKNDIQHNGQTENKRANNDPLDKELNVDE